MSAYIESEVQITNHDALLAALKDMGYDKVETERGHLYGYKGDVREQQADVIVRKKYVGRASNDIGFARNPDGTYTALVSEYDTGYLQNKHKCPDFLAELKARAGAHAAVTTAQRMGRKVTTAVEGRKIVLTITRGV